MTNYFDIFLSLRPRRTELLLCALGLLFVLLQSTSSAKRPFEKWCSRDCEDYPRKQVCATNNVTFASRCDMFHYSCLTHIEIEIAYKGPCTELTQCQMQRIRRKQQQALAKKQQQAAGGPGGIGGSAGAGGGGLGAANIHMPQCYKKSGNFVAKQCTNGYCWCVQPTTGQFVPGTSDREQGFRHDCNSHVTADHEALSNTKAEIEDDTSCSGEEKRKFRKSIHHLITKIEFNSNSASDSNDLYLLQGLVGDWQQASTAASSASTLSPIHARFLELDTNRDGILQKKELHEYRRYVKLMVPEKVCARTMQLHCDLDGSGHLEYSEWLVCVKPDEPSVLFNTFDTEDGVGTGAGINSGAGGLHEWGAGSGIGAGGLSVGGGASGHAIHFPNRDPYSDYYDPVLRIDYDSIDNPKPIPINPNQDCFARRKSQLEMNVIPLPECESDGRFKAVQCSEVAFTKICWCVDETSGLALKIRGSGQIVKAKDPSSLNCNQVNKRYSPTSEECAGDLQFAFDTMFLKALETHLKPLTDANDSSFPPSVSSSSSVTNDTTAAAAAALGAQQLNSFWSESFSLFDTEPRDSYVTSSELGWAVRLAENSLKKGAVCAHTIVPRCDLSQDQKLSQYEWNACFNQGDPRLPIE